MQHFVSVLLFALAYQVKGQTKDDQVFAYSQVMTNCVGQQFTDQQTARIITAVRRCEQVTVQPLRDQALQQVITDLSSPLGGGGRVVYVPVAVPPGTLGGGLGGVGGASPFGFNPFGGAGLAQPFGAAGGFGGIQGAQSGFNNLNNLNSLNSLGSNFGRPDSTFSPSNSFGGFGQTTTDRTRTRENNPFGLFGKQTTEGETAPVVSEQETEKLTQDEGSPLKRERRQTAADRFTRAEALYYLSNMTCVMREAGMIDHNNLPNYQFVENELRRTQLDRELRNDFASGLLFCKELTQCMPVERLNHPLARELGQAIAYFRCIARANVKACRKQDERRNQGSARLTGSFNFFNGNGRDLLRSVTELALSDDALGFDFF